MNVVNFIISPELLETHMQKGIKGYAELWKSLMPFCLYML